MLCDYDITCVSSLIYFLISKKIGSSLFPENVVPLRLFVLFLFVSSISDAVLRCYLTLLNLYPVPWEGC